MANIKDEAIDVMVYIKALVVELEDQWGINHDDTCSNTHNCTSFLPKSIKECTCKRPDIIGSAKKLLKANPVVCEECCHVYAPELDKCPVCGTPNERLK